MVVPGGVDRSGEYRVIPALLALIQRLAAHHTVHVFALRQEPQPARWDLAGARIHNIGIRRTRLRAVRAICAEHRASPFQLIQSIWSGACGLVGVSAARLLGIPCLVHVAGGEPVSLPEIGFGGRLTWRGRLREAVVCRGATLLTAASAPQIAALAKYGFSAERLPLGVDLHAWPPRLPAGRNLCQPARLIHVASLNRVKDQSTLLRAIASVARSGLTFHLDIVGEDVLDGEIQGLVRSLGLGKVVTFHGFLTQRQLRPLIEAAHLMLLSSRHEAGPVVVLEAAALGVPTVGTAVGHVAEWSPEAALAAPVGESEALAAAVRRVLADEDLRLRLGRTAFTRATLEDADYTARRFEALYAALIGTRVASTM
jgi:glycosyltransferase involved in cell wall biosynthesis